MSGYVCPCGHADCGMHSQPVAPVLYSCVCEDVEGGSLCTRNCIPVTKREEGIISSETIKPVDSALPTGSEARKNVPLARGLLDYFPAALAAVAAVSKAGNDKHNPGQEMHHARGKSTDHADCIMRHLVDRGTVDQEDGMRHTAKVAWRALALLQEELEDAGEAPLPRGARL